MVALDASGRRLCDALTALRRAVVLRNRLAAAGRTTPESEAEAKALMTTVLGLVLTAVSYAVADETGAAGSTADTVAELRQMALAAAAAARAEGIGGDD